MTVKVQVYQKATHRDQYLHFSSHHPLKHKLGVICTLYDRCDNIVTEKADAARDGYLNWSFKRVREQMDQWERKNNRKISKIDSKDKSTKTSHSALRQVGF